jgi:hypothetical protein
VGAGGGRPLLNTFFLVHEEILREPILYLSIFFKRHRRDYHDRLQAIREKGDWEGWLAFFLEGIADVSTEATTTARQIVRLREEERARIAQQLGRQAASGLQLLEHLFRNPVVNVKRVEEVTGLSQPAANALTNAMAHAGVLREMTGRKTYRLFGFDKYLQLFDERDVRSSVSRRWYGSLAPYLTVRPPVRSGSHLPEPRCRRDFHMKTTLRSRRKSERR